MNNNKIINISIIQLKIFKSISKSMIKLLLLVLLAHRIRSDCLLNPYPRQLVTGIVNVQLNNNPNLHGTLLQYTYSLDQHLQQPGVSVLIAIVGLQLNSNNQFDFTIEYLPGTQLNSLKFRIQVNDPYYGWRLLTFSFLASQSSLFQTSTQIVTQFSSSAQDGKYSVYRPILNFNSFQIQPIVKIFIHGLQIKAKPLDDQYSQMLKKFETFKKFSTNGKLVTYFSEALQQKKSISFRLFGNKLIGRIISFSIQTNAYLNSLRFSYLIFSKKTFTQKHTFIHNDFYLLNGNQFKFTSLQNMNMIITGLSGFKLPRDQLYNFNLQIRSYFGQTEYQASTNYKYFTLDFTYIAFQMQQKYICDDCVDSPNIFENKFCVEVCPRSYSRILRLDNYYCQKCDVQQLKVVDPNTGDCICAKRHYLDKTQNVCKPCSYDCMTCIKPNQCLTCDNSLLQTKRKLNTNGNCVCPTIGYYDDKNAQDIVCQSCYSTCLTCNGPRPHNCLTCSLGKQLDSLGFCVCENGFAQDTRGNCTCLPPRILYNNICLDIETKCNQNQVQQFFQLIRKCICKQQFIQVGQNCIKCGANSIFDQKQLRCKCTNKTVNLNGQCVQCMQNQVYDEFLQICVCKPGNFQSDQGKCITCPKKMTYMNGHCQCIFNYFQRQPGICERCVLQTNGTKCPKNSF